MGDSAHHSSLAREKREAALDEYQKGRYTVVGDLALKAVEQAIEAAASREGLHFHLNPRTAHARRTTWAKRKFPSIAADLDLVWGAYGDLGYDGLNGRRAYEAIQAMERIMNEIESETGIRLK
ncbi:MAG TPA: hypothetical protein EYP68_00045 [Candidatus Korarchaeota archaeon]|nr:hypothetical protein [Candidatus Korarchaeota archaeon]